MLATPIKDLNLRKQTEQILKRAGFEYIEEIQLAIKDNRLITTRNLGKRGYNEILEKVEEWEKMSRDTSDSTFNFLEMWDEEIERNRNATD